MVTRVVVVGSMNFDMVARVERLPRRHEKIRAAEFSFCPGGAAANTAYWLARNGLMVMMVGAVGADHQGSECLNALKSAGVDTNSVVVTGGARTGVAMVWSTARDKRMITAPGPPIDVALENFDSSILRPGDIVHVASRPSSALRQFCYMAADAGAKVSVEFNGRSMEDIRPIVSIAFMNADELRRVLGIDWQSLTPDIVAEFLPAPDREFVVTLGARGAVVVTRNGAVRADTRRVVALDRTGAGDAFDAGYLMVRGQGGDEHAALRRGLDLASIVLQSVGARS
ncbi:MAG: carbohydrate kinase family protein [Actinomycetota bacterium]|nr:carbohydrate kinase family protein [Actinomycetota bacterium]